MAALPGPVLLTSREQTLLGTGVVFLGGAIQFGLGFTDLGFGETLASRFALLVVVSFLAGAALGILIALRLLSRRWMWGCLASCWGAILVGLMSGAMGSLPQAFVIVLSSVGAAVIGGVVGSAVGKVLSSRGSQGRPKTVR